MLYEMTAVEKILGGRKILDIASLAIRCGRIYSLTGPNGAGKTTLLKILAFLDKPNAGAMHFRSQKVSNNEKDLLELRRQVVLVDQSPLLFTGTVAKNVEFGLRMRKIGSTERRQRVFEALKLVGMDGFIEAEAHNLSGGETKRVALARALAIRPLVLLCDEPTANVDSENQRIILDILAEITRTENTSIIFSTHYLSQEEELAHHCLHLEHGKISECATDKVYHAELLERGEKRSTYRLAEQLNISLPATSVPVSQHFFLTIDQGKISILEEISVEQTGNLLQGRVTGTVEEKGMIRMQVDAGISFNFSISSEMYRAKPALIGESVTLWIPDEAMHCIADTV